MYASICHIDIYVKKFTLLIFNCFIEMNKQMHVANTPAKYQQRGVAISKLGGVKDIYPEDWLSFIQSVNWHSEVKGEFWGNSGDTKLTGGQDGLLSSWII